MSKDIIYREDAIKALYKYSFVSKDVIEREIKAIPSADIDLSEYSDKLWKNAYERGKADGAMIYGNEHNCIMTIFGECSYAETGCGDCAIVEKVRKALSADRPQEWIPCSERLPRARKSVLLAVNHKCGDWVGEGCYWETTDNHIIWKGYRWNATYWDDEIIAWMPLPEPWKGATDGNK